MKTRNKIRIDRFVGLPLVCFLNPLVRILGRFLLINHSIEEKTVRTIVVAKFVGIGSILQATPMIRALKNSFPRARLILLTEKANEPVVSCLRGIDSAVYINSRSVIKLACTTLTALFSLVRQRADLYFDLEVYSAYSAVICVTSLARNRLGFYRHSAEFKCGIYTHLMYLNTRQPIRTAYLQLARMAGVGEPPGGDRLEPLRVENTDRERLFGKLEAETGWRRGEPYLVVNPNASDLLLERRWPSSHAERMLEMLSEDDIRIFLVGSLSEEAYVNGLIQRLSERARRFVFSIAGRLDLPELFALLEKAACVVTNDTGPMHMAVAMGAPTVALFGPGHPAHYGFKEPNVRILYEPVFCSPCLYETAEPPCAGDNVCMRAIRPERVVAAVRRLLSAPLVRDDDASREELSAGGRHVPSVCFDDSHRPLGMVTASSIPVMSPQLCPVCGESQFIPLCHKGGYGFWRCVRCKLERVDPQPHPDDLRAIYGERYYDAWGFAESREISSRPKKAFFREQLEKLGDLRPGSKVLDCGAGVGFLMDVARDMGFEAYGTEWSDFGSCEIKSRFGGDRMYCGPLETVGFPGLGDHAFDALLMFDFIEHVPQPVQVLDKAHRLLKPGGWLMISTPDTSSLSRRMMRSFWPHVKLEHLHCFNRKNLTQLLQQKGFKVSHVGTATKVMNLQYVKHQLETYPIPVFTSLFCGAVRILPGSVRSFLFRIHFGEMILSCQSV